MSLEKKYNKLKVNLKDLGSVLVAFSSGVDSSFLLKTAHDVLGDNVIAVTAKSQLFPNRELEEAKAFCLKNKIKHIIVDIDIENIKHNPVNRCYICKKNIFSKFLEIAKLNNIKYVIEGSNIDDDKDYRPGALAVKELNIISPLKEAGLTKEEIRTLSGNKKPSFACLASRFVYGEEITEEKLKMVEQAEQLLFEAGFKQFRVRLHGKLARIEVLKTEFNKFLNSDIYSKIKNLGFDYVTMDLQGYRTGSMNETINTK